MLTQTATEALNIAMEMERRGIMIYRRAQMLTEDKQVLDLLKRLEADELIHLGKFSAMLDGAELSEDMGEKRVVLTAYAQKALLKGGVMELLREDALKSVDKLLAHAIKDEQEAVDIYRGYSTQAEAEPVKNVFWSISLEEEKHLGDLIKMAEQMGFAD